ncbi:hypothetical protein MtrunA17_Chr3g0114651 [Medicago truncatula]|uniref:Transmembrane protein n=1 Tax=Medicago truncatula TaxID=3880 RepID=A0A396IZW1_MEDTR|nr:hypothetical protein MtrunA17_Chr3g0114651 [Medicago truncatula]
MRCYVGFCCSLVLACCSLCVELFGCCSLLSIIGIGCCRNLGELEQFIFSVNLYWISTLRFLCILACFMLFFINNISFGF